jgi:N-acetylmuramoyl-L-alanine amidase
MDTFRADVKSGLASVAPIEPTAPKEYYRVQLGAFSVKANADAMLSKVKEAGFNNAFIKYSE